MNKEEYKEYYSSVYRHSLAHVLADAVMEIFGKENVQIAIGPQIADGFYYDFLLPRNLTAEDYPAGNGWFFRCQKLQYTEFQLPPDPGKYGFHRTIRDCSRPCVLLFRR